MITSTDIHLSNVITETCTAIVDTMHRLAHEVNDFFESFSLPQFTAGFGIGIFCHKIYVPLTDRLLTLFGYGVMPATTIFTRVLEGAYVCLFAPIVEEMMFRGGMQEVTKDISEFLGPTASKVASVFMTSLVFGLSHFLNAVTFGCSPMLFLPQVIATFIMGIMFGIAKEVTGKLEMPIGMHMGNNTLAWLLSPKPFGV